MILKKKNHIKQRAYKSDSNSETCIDNQPLTTHAQIMWIFVEFCKEFCVQFPQRPNGNRTSVDSQTLGLFITLYLNETFLNILSENPRLQPEQ